MIKIVVLFIFSLNIFAYDNKDINLSNFEFNRYVRPQLISISHDFQTLLTALNPELKELKNLGNTLQDIKKRTSSLEKLYIAQKFNECEFNLNQSLKQFSMGLLLLEVPPSLYKKEYFTADNLIESLHSFQIFRQSFFDLYLEFKNFQYLIRAKTQLTKPIKSLLQEINITQSSFQTFVLKSSDNRFRTEFSSFWSDFLRPVQNLILPQNDKSLFIHKLNDFNLRLNILNVTLTKRNKKTNKQTATILKIIHNRWNNILKVTLKR